MYVLDVCYMTLKCAKSYISVKKLISTSERCAEHPFVGRNTQQIDNSGTLIFLESNVVEIGKCNIIPIYLISSMFILIITSQETCLKPVLFFHKVFLEKNGMFFHKVTMQRKFIARINQLSQTFTGKLLLALDLTKLARLH